MSFLHNVLVNQPQDQKQEIQAVVEENDQSHPKYLFIKEKA